MPKGTEIKKVEAVRMARQFVGHESKSGDSFIQISLETGIHQQTISKKVRRVLVDALNLYEAHLEL